MILITLTSIGKRNKPFLQLRQYDPALSIWQDEQPGWTELQSTINMWKEYYILQISIDLLS